MSWEYACCIVLVIFIESDTDIIELSVKNRKFLSCLGNGLNNATCLPKTGLLGVNRHKSCMEA